MFYDHRSIEKKWQQRWEAEGAFRALDDHKRPKYYALVEFPYPSGDGLHVGHLRPYVGLDIIARKRRMEGFNVLYPIGWDAFGLPAENYAIKTGEHPRVTTEKNTANYRRQIKVAGISFDWSREVNTTDPTYYRWTQWIFLQLFKKGLAYKARTAINWCPKDKIGLANEEVVGGCCERCGGPVEKREKEQWMLAITKYAEKLLDGLKTVDYIPRAKTQQQNWIGRSEGATINFPLLKRGGEGELLVSVFTTRPDTLFGATYIVLAPEHPLVAQITTDDQRRAVEKYVLDAKRRTEIERTSADKEKTGVFTGAYAINPANDEKIPIWVADYVLASYGTGAIMAVPAHDERDFAFAKKYKLPVRRVVVKAQAPIKSFIMGGEALTETDLQRLDVKIVERTNKGFLKVIIPQASLERYEKLIIEKMTPGFWNEYIADVAVFIFKHKDGRVERLVLNDATNEKIDRYGAEFNDQKWEHASSVWRWLAENSWYTDVIVHSEQGTLTNSARFDGMSSEDAKAAITKAVGGKKTVTYHLRDWVFSRQRYWGEPIPIVHCEKCGYVPVPEKDLPVLLPDVEKYQPTETGESPLATITEWVNTKCPTCKGPAKRETDVMPNWAGSSWYFLRYCDPTNTKALADRRKLEYWMPVDWYNGGMEHTTLHLLYSRFWNLFLHDIGVVPVSEPYRRRTSHGLILAEDGEKMSKSRGNVVNPDDIIEKFGADTLRMYEMFIGPFDQAAPWSTNGLVGVRRFLDKVWRVGQTVILSATKDLEILHSVQDDKTKRLIAKTVKRISDDIEAMRFNTAVAAFMELFNALDEQVARDNLEVILRLLSPFAPHLAEELWSSLGHKTTITREPWPTYDPALVRDDEITLVIQVDGKLRDTLRVPAGISEEDAKARALASEKVQKHLAGRQPSKVIFIPGRLVSIVTQ